MEPRKLVTWTVLILIGAAAGAFFNLVVMGNGRPMIGAAFGVMVGAPMFAFMRGLLMPRLQLKLRRLPFLLYAPAMVAVYIVLIVLSTEFAGALLWSLGFLPEPFLTAITVPAADVIYSLAILAIITFMLRVKDLIGGEAFLSLLNGRYHKPVSEERIFLFIDVVGSTQFAERFGDLRAQEYLGALLRRPGGPGAQASRRDRRLCRRPRHHHLAFAARRRGGALRALRLRDPRRDRAGGALLGGRFRMRPALPRGVAWRIRGRGRDRRRPSQDLLFRRHGEHDRAG